MINRLIGNYRITSELAQGGMGAVYRGRHQNLPRDVVVKAILLSSFPPSAQEHLKARFVREAYVQSQLDHPNIVRVYEFFTTVENYYLVLEFIDGMSLREMIHRRGALDPLIALPLFKQALSALDYAHNFSYVDESGRSLKGVTHRDIKPANLLLDRMGRLKITDFGIVKLAGESSMTRTGFNPGTVEYMSPEQILGLVVNARSDIYSLGVTFYEVLSGRLPFPPSDTGSGYEVMKGHTELAPPPLLEVRPNLPEALAELVMRALEKDPANRFQTAAEWLDALFEYESGTAIERQTEVIAERSSQVASTGQSIATDVLAPIEATERLPEPASEPAGPKSSLTALLLAGSVVVFLIAAAAAYLLWKWQLGPPEASTVLSQNAPAATATLATALPTAGAQKILEDERLRQARVAEEEERYPEAIKLFEEYLSANAKAADASAISKHLSELKSLNGHLQMAKFFMGKKDFSDARKDYADALKLRPNSKLALAGLTEANAQISRSP